MATKLNATQVQVGNVVYTFNLPKNATKFFNCCLKSAPATCLPKNGHDGGKQIPLPAPSPLKETLTQKILRMRQAGIKGDVQKINPQWKP